jgi:hypothetical protein
MVCNNRELWSIFSISPDSLQSATTTLCYYYESGNNCDRSSWEEFADVHYGRWLSKSTAGKSANSSRNSCLSCYPTCSMDVHKQHNNIIESKRRHCTTSQLTQHFLSDARLALPIHHPPDLLRQRQQTASVRLLFIANLTSLRPLFLAEISATPLPPLSISLRRRRQLATRLDK